MPKEIINGDLEVTGALSTNSGVPTNLNDLNDVNVPDPLSLSDNGKQLVARYELPAEYGTGADADFIGGTTPNPLAYTDLTTNIGIGDTILTVRDALPFNIGDEVLIHQTQVGQDTAPANLAKRGRYEYATILSKDDTQPAGLDTITISMGVVNSYDSDSDGNKSNNQKTQILKVYNYDNVNLAAGDISAPNWNGFSGGILAFRCSGLLTGSGSIDMSGNGFRGGPATAQGAEGWSGTNNALQNVSAIDSGAPGGGTGGGAEPGAGGGHNGAGTDSNGVDASGLGYNLSTLESNINIGGGGSGGNSGGNSGGAIVAFVADFSGYSGTVNSAGAAAPVAGSDVGGTGGAILFYSPTDFTGTTDITAGPSFNAGEAVSAAGYSTLTQPPTSPLSLWEAKRIYFNTHIIMPAAPVAIAASATNQPVPGLSYTIITPGDYVFYAMVTADIAGTDAKPFSITIYKNGIQEANSRFGDFAKKNEEQSIATTYAINSLVSSDVISVFINNDNIDCDILLGRLFVQSWG